MKEYKKPKIFIEELSTISNFCDISQAEGPLQTFGNDGKGTYEDFSEFL